jgi:hypothetical protein
MVTSVRGTEDTVTCIYRPDILNDEQRKKNIERMMTFCLFL